MRVISKKTLREAWEKYNEIEDWLKQWNRVVEKSNWNNVNELKLRFPACSVLNNDILIFNVKGNKFRLAVRVNFKMRAFFIIFIGTHPEYDKIDFRNYDYKNFKNRK